MKKNWLLCFTLVCLAVSLILAQPPASSRPASVSETRGVITKLTMAGDSKSETLLATLSLKTEGGNRFSYQIHSGQPWQCKLGEQVIGNEKLGVEKVLSDIWPGLWVKVVCQKSDKPGRPKILKSLELETAELVGEVKEVQEELGLVVVRGRLKGSVKKEALFKLKIVPDSKFQNGEGKPNELSDFQSGTPVEGWIGLSQAKKDNLLLRLKFAYKPEPPTTTRPVSPRDPVNRHRPPGGG